jgi:xanthine dehydrogenase accessory factor
MKKIFGEIVELMGDKQSFVVATIFDQNGSAPRTTGAKMLVRKDGTISGTVGGGRLEAEAIRAALDVLKSGMPVIHEFVLTGEDAAGMDMICGGTGRVLLDYIDGSNENSRVVYEEASSILEQSERGFLVTIVSSANKTGTEHFLVKSDGTVSAGTEFSSLVMSQLLNSAAIHSIKSVHMETIEGRQFMIEPLRNSGTVYIFGAGHVSQKIAPLSEMVGFKTVVLDDRTEFANRQRFPGSAEIIVLESFERLPQLEVDTDSYIVIVTRGHLHDKTILAGALRTNAGYIGMIGSRRKRDKIYEALAAEGFSKKDVERVYSPIGTDIGAETPEELAVSIVGELIKVRAAKDKNAI